MGGQRPARARAAWRRVALAVTWLVVLAGGSWLVQDSESGRVRDIDQRYLARVETSARFVEAYAQEVFQRERVLATSALRADIDPAAFSALMTASGFAAAVVVRSDGTALAAQPAGTGVVGTDLAAQYAHLRRALLGTPTVSGVVPSAVLGVPVVAFAVPFEAEDGRRVFSAAHLASRTPLQRYLQSEADGEGERIHLVDALGMVVTSSALLPAGLGTLAAIDPALTDFTAPGVRQVGDGGAARQVVTVAVAGTPWTLVFAAQQQVLYEPIYGSDRWVPWLALIALALALTVVMVLFERNVSQRARMASQQRRSRTALDTAGDAFVATDSTGRIRHWNAAAAELFGWTRQEALGQPMAELIVPPRHRVGQSRGGWELLHTDAPGGLPAPVQVSGSTGGAARPVELTGLTRAGVEVPLEASASVAAGQGGTELYAFFRDIRSRHAAERAMRMSAQVAESAGDAIYSRDLSGRITSWNASAERLFGWSAEEMSTSGLDHPFLGTNADHMDGMIKRSADTQTVHRGETVRVSSTGEQIDLAMTLAPLVDAEGAVVGVSVVARDIRKRRRLEADLRTSEGMFRSAFDDALLGMVVIGMDGTLRRVNKVFADFLGCPMEDLPGRVYEDLIHPDFRAGYDQHKQQARAGVESFRDETCYRRPDGRAVWADTSASLVRDPRGVPLHYVAQLVDTTQRRVARGERDSRDAMLAAVIANSQSMIYVKDLDGRYLLANAPFEAAFAVTEAELLGRTDAYLDPDLAAVWQANDMLARDGAYHLEEWSDAPDGRHYYESVKFPLHDADGRLYATCGVSLDVTAQREASLAVARSRDEAVEATAAKSAFLATMSHEIRTPMNAVIGMTGLLLDTDLDEQQRDFVETVRTSGDALLTVINDILDFSKIEAGQLTVEHRSFDLPQVAESALDLLAVAAADKELELVCFVDPRCPTHVVGDESRLRQVLANLVSNAVKFTASGHVLLTVSTLEHDGDGHQIALAVSDTGMGIPLDRMDRLFRSFSQVDDSTTRVYGGTGLGLAISRRLAWAMGGDLSATSEPGQGSTFTCTVLVGADPEAPADQRPPAVLIGKTALVLERDLVTRQVVELRLAADAIDVVAVATAAEALALVAAGSVYDLALLDARLLSAPGAEAGAEAAGELVPALRRLSGGATLPLVLLAGLRTPSPLLAADVTAVVTKPMKTAVLREALVSALSAPVGPELSELQLVAAGALSAGGGSTGGGSAGVRSTGAGSAGVGPDAAAQAVARPAASGPAASGSAPVAGRQRILLVEDNPVNQKVAQLMLGKLGHLVDTVGNGREAVDAVRSVPYDVILMDVQMPVMDGLEATRAIRSMLAADRQPYIVAMTASALLEDREACLAAGMDTHLPKPVRQPELAAAIGRRHSARATGGPGAR